jgi:hypothetical protein
LRFFAKSTDSTCREGILEVAMKYRQGPAGASIIAAALLYLIYRGLETVFLSPVCRWEALRSLIALLAGYTLVGIFVLLSSRHASALGMLLFPHLRQRQCLANDQIRAFWRF